MVRDTTVTNCIKPCTAFLQTQRTLTRRTVSLHEGDEFISLCFRQWYVREGRGSGEHKINYALFIVCRLQAREHHLKFLGDDS